jgi:hypothetical protein
MQQVMHAALGAPTAATQLKEAEGVLEVEAHSGAAAAAMIASRYHPWGLC